MTRLCRFQYQHETVQNVAYIFEDFLERCEIEIVKEGKSSDKIEKIDFFSIMHYLPTGLSTFFPRLKTLLIITTRLKEITSQDLKGFDNLEFLKLSDNDLKSLPDDLFVHTKELSSVDLMGNKLESFTSKVFEGRKWAFVDLRENTCINFCYCEGMDFSNFLNVIDAAARKKPQNLMEKIWEMKEFCDFEFVIGSTQYPVNKCVIAAQSSVFALMLKNNEEVKETNRLEIMDCCKDDFEVFLRFLYTSEIEESKVTLSVFNIACSFDVFDLKTTCERIIVNNLSEDDAPKALNYGNFFKSQEVIEAAFAKIKEKYPNDVLSDDLKNDPARVNEIIKLRNLINDLNQTKIE